MGFICIPKFVLIRLLDSRRLGASLFVRGLLFLDGAFGSFPGQSLDTAGDGRLDGLLQLWNVLHGETSLLDGLLFGRAFFLGKKIVEGILHASLIVIPGIETPFALGVEINSVETSDNLSLERVSMVS